MIYLAYVEYARYLLPPHRELSPQEKHKHHQGLYKLNLKRCVQHETIPGHKEAMCCSKNMYFINQDTRAPGVVIWVLDHHLPGVELGLGTGATHDVVVQSGLLLVTTNECPFMYQIHFHIYRRPQASFRSGSPTRSGSLHSVCCKIRPVRNRSRKFDNISSLFPAQDPQYPLQSLHASD